MRILTRYLVARFLGFFAAFLIVSTATIVIVEMMLNLGDMLRGDEGLPGVARYLLLRVPSYYLRDLVPVVAFAAAFFTLSSASRWLEVTAMRAGGLSPHEIAVPILLASAVLAGATFVVNETLILRATRLWNLRSSDSGVPITFRQGSFWYHRGRTIYNIGESDRVTRTLRGVHIYELDADGHLERSIASERAVVQGVDRWLFASPVVRVFSTSEPSRAPETTRHEGDIALDLRDETDLALMNADVTTLSLAQIREVIAHRTRSGRVPSRLEALLHARLADPLAVLIFVLVAIPLGIRVESAESRGVVLPALLGILFMGAFFSLRSVGTTLATGGILPPSPVPWLLAAAFALFGTWRYARMPA